MSQRATLAVILAIASGCASTPEGDMPGASRGYLLGTWTDIDTIETFLPDGTYCSSPAGAGYAHSAGTWVVDTDGYVSIDIKKSLDPADIDPDGAYEIRVVQIPRPGHLLMGYMCTHCPGGVAGSVYRRSLPQRNSCGFQGHYGDEAYN